MLFGRNNTDLAAIHNFYVSTSSGSPDKPIAYGPGSIINGSLMITNDKPLSAKNIRIVFKCEAMDSSKREKSSVFSVDTVIWGNPKESAATRAELPQGSHMYLFAIRLPQVNYPPSMHDSHFGHRIGYTLQGVIDLESEPHFTATVPILYLPLVTTNLPTSKMTQVFEKENKKIQVTAELIKPAYCPGDLCTVKMITNNNSDSKISSVQVQLQAVATTLNPNHSAATLENEHIHKQYTILSESFYVSIAKQARDHQDIFKFQIPSNLVPTFTNKMGKYIDIAYRVEIALPSQSSAGGIFNSQQQLVTNTIVLPITIATVPPSYPIQIEIHESTSNDELPTFIPNIESPLPSPVHYPADRAYSVSPSNSFQMSSDMDISEEDADFVLNRNESQIDASGHLMVPDAADGRRKSSSASSELSENASTLANSSRLEIVS
ncbi:hypothetical protein FB192DRAFT_1455304 [Mucor lusitanicus]|uniref:Arrestin C-terminal-like domain-containing protein n=2 Tax=Mucor circinelloides f. lusitanicus TaxID=29924 RepID=A0A168MJQ1_MUCCL|nr:hypothetical protein FB192DRAFT_1455304 [Mucor lusitanicus]OAD05036.1 hypothetical protein MUCCIDRAFT_80125 [Mucor lusitanicus CBS 277.49]